jgi:hypothetical protein
MVNSFKAVLSLPVSLMALGAELKLDIKDQRSTFTLLV